MTLSEFVDIKGKAGAAKELGVSPAAIFKALKEGRNIAVTIHVSGQVTAVETKPFPGRAI